MDDTGFLGGSRAGHEVEESGARGPEPRAQSGQWTLYRGPGSGGEDGVPGENCVPVVRPGDRLRSQSGETSHFRRQTPR